MPPNARGGRTRGRRLRLTLNRAVIGVGTLALGFALIGLNTNESETGPTARDSVSAPVVGAPPGPTHETRDARAWKAWTRSLPRADGSRSADPEWGAGTQPATRLASGSQPIGAVTSPAHDAAPVTFTEALFETLNPDAHLLGQVIFGSPDPGLRQRALDLLNTQTGPAATALIRAATDDPDPGVQTTARALLDQRPSHSPVEPSGPGYTSAGYTRIAEVAARLERPEPDERIAAIDELYGAPGDVALETLRAVLVHDPEPEVRAAAVAAMGWIAAAGTTEALEDGLGDADAGVRAQVLDAMVMGQWDTLPVLGQVLLIDPAPTLRRRAIERIARVGTPAGRAFLQQAMNDPDDEVRRIAARHLGH